MIIRGCGGADASMTPKATIETAHPDPPADVLAVLAQALVDIEGTDETYIAGFKAACALMGNTLFTYSQKQAPSDGAHPWRLLAILEAALQGAIPDTKRKALPGDPLS